METAGLVAPVDFSVPEEGTKVVISQRRPRLVVMAPNTAVFSVYFRGHVFNLIRKYELDKGLELSEDQIWANHRAAKL